MTENLTASFIRKFIVLFLLCMLAYSNPIVDEVYEDALMMPPEDIEISDGELHPSDIVGDSRCMSGGHFHHHPISENKEGDDDYVIMEHDDQEKEMKRSACACADLTTDQTTIRWRCTHKRTLTMKRSACACADLTTDQTTIRWRCTHKRTLTINKLKAKEDLKELSDDKLLLFGGNPSFTETGERIVEGDIVVPKYADDHKELSHRKGTINLLALWPRSTVYYTLHYSLNPLGRRMIREAMEHWENHTCIKFVERTTQLWYLRFRGDRSGCWSAMGRNLLPLIGQDLSIGNRCEKRYVVIHELGHALGLNHEQSRLDRDRHVRVLWRNIALGGRTQFWRGLDNPRGVEYDLTSIMHYHPQAFSSRMFERNTVVARNPHFQRLVGKKRNDLSFRDAKVVNNMYRCDSGCTNKGQLYCDNGGYIGGLKNGDEGTCVCICPPHTSGTKCEYIVRSYYEEPPCGGNITEEMTIETPGFPNRTEPEMSCSWIIKAPFMREVEVEFEDFSFRERLQQQSSSYYGRCVHERVEIRTDDYFTGSFYCGTDISPGTKMTSKGGTFIMLIAADDEMEGKGLRAHIRFV